jgi:hypothetical protein
MPTPTDHLYFIQADKTGLIKIGRSKHPKKRLKELQTGCGTKLKLIAVFEGKGSYETTMHDKLKPWRKKGEWFDYDCIGSIPISFYEQIPFGAFDDWWQE